MTGEGTKGSDINREDNQGGDGVKVSVIGRWCAWRFAGADARDALRNNKQPGDLEAREGAHVTIITNPIIILSNTHKCYNICTMISFWATSHILYLLHGKPWAYFCRVKFIWLQNQFQHPSTALLITVPSVLTCMLSAGPRYIFVARPTGSRSSTSLC